MNINFVTDVNFINNFEKSKELILRATPECDLSALKNEWKKAFENKRAIFLTAETDNQIVGILLGVVDFNACTQERTFTECHWYVLPEHRHTAGIKLYQAVCDYVKKDFCKVLIFNCPTSNQKLENFYIKNGFKEVNKSFRKEL